MPGCVDSVIDGKDGFIVKTGDISALESAMAKFIDIPDMAVEMGQAARQRACEIYDVHKVNEILLTSMGLEAPKE
jgi:glycosyltransferase involved in cell wall biosynthesis